MKKRFSLSAKLSLGTAFLVLLLALCAGLGIFTVIRLREQAGEVLKDNYESLRYVQQMQDALAQTPVDTAVFESALRAQEGNITEPGEGESTRRLRQGFCRLLADPNGPHLSIIQLKFNEIQRFNLDAIARKNALSEQVAARGQTTLSVLAAIFVIIGFTFAFSFPDLISRPVAELNKAIGEIGAKNYAYRIQFASGDEFGELAAAINAMTEKLNAYEHSNLARLMFEKSRAEAVINSLHDASIGIDPGGVVLFANPEALSLLGLRAEGLIGKPASAIAAHNDLLRMLLDPTQAQAFRVVVNEVEGFYTREILPITGEKGSLGSLLIIRNITAFQERDIARTNFIATISHELKTPLASADIGLKLLERDANGLSAQQREIVADLKQDNQRLIRLVSELLDLSQAETGHLHLRMEAVPAQDLVTAAVGAIKQQAEAKSIRFETAFPEALPALYADREKAIWVMVNVLSNAVKFSPPGSAVVISVEIIGNEVICIVEDQGPGIPEGMREQVFDRFFTRGGKGTGLGLYIARQFMEAMEGSISLESGPGTRVAMIFRRAA